MGKGPLVWRKQDKDVGLDTERPVSENEAKGVWKATRSWRGHSEPDGARRALRNQHTEEGKKMQDLAEGEMELWCRSNEGSSKVLTLPIYPNLE